MKRMLILLLLAFAFGQFLPSVQAEPSANAPALKMHAKHRRHHQGKTHKLHHHKKTLPK